MIVLKTGFHKSENETPKGRKFLQYNFVNFWIAQVLFWEFHEYFVTIVFGNQFGKKDVVFNFARK